MKVGRLLLMPLLFWGSGVLAASTNNLDPDQLAYNLKTSVEAYEKVGRKNGKWDADAKQCLTAFAQILASTNQAIGGSVSELRSMLSRLNEEKCDDPLVRYLFSRLIFADSHSASENAEAFDTVAKAMAQSDYPDIRKFFATVWACRMRQKTDSRRQEITNLLHQATVYLAKALEDKSMPSREADESCELLMSTPWWAEPARWNCYQGLEPALSNRWSESSWALLAKGLAYLSYAWQARGTGYANSVSQAGWQLMAQRLDTAAEALEAAWKLNPHDVCICREMLRVELGQGKGRDRLEMWFRRGMQVDPANYDLCYEKLEYLRPRWYGSIQAMIDFGRGCTLNTNWAGDVRLMLAYAHYEAFREIQDRAQREVYWQGTNVWADIHFAFEQFFKLYPQAVGYRHNYAFYAAQCGQWQEFLNQAKQFPSTNYEYFGGVERFNSMVQLAEEKTKRK